MSVFAYTARDAMGTAVSGTMEGASLDAVQKALRAEGKYPTNIRPAGAARVDSSLPDPSRSRMSRNDLLQISMQLAIMLETGVVLSEALECIANQADKPHVKAIVEDLSRQVQEGRDFSAALAQHPRSFPRLYVALVKASEKSGMLSKLIARATSYLRDEQETRRRVKGALTYPAIMLVFAIGTTIFLLTFVLPKFTAIYIAKKAALPMPTQVLIAISDFFVHHWMMLIVIVVCTVVGGTYTLRQPGGARAWHWVQLRIPLMGKMFRKLHLSRGLRMVGTMAGAGVNILDCVVTAKDLCSNVYYRDLWDCVANDIQTGKQISEPFFESNLVPRSVAQMLHSGEKSGKLAMVLDQISGFAETELKEQIAELTRYIEPAMICIMGFIIGGVALALLLPIFTISKVMAS